MDDLKKISHFRQSDNPKKSLAFRLGQIFATGLGIGYAPWVPGTFGTLWGVLIFYGVRDFPLGWMAVLLVGILLLSVGACYLAERGMEGHDSPHIVIDEVIGYLFSIFAIPFSWPNVLIAFLLFRFFDIVKPPPIRWIDRSCPGAWGVVLDDVVAGIFANLCFWIILWVRGAL